MLTIDGSSGEGGGQILRTSLALSVITGQAFRMHDIRARRPKPGLMRQHLTAVEAAAAISSATVEGSAVGSRSLVFRPSACQAGQYHFAVGTAGSATLVLQTVLPALMLASGESSLILEGGTHNPMSPPFDFLVKAYLPLVRRMGPMIEAQLERPGFYPAGGGRFRVKVTPAAKLTRLEMMERGAMRAQQARAIVAAIPKNVADRELRVVGARLGWDRSQLQVEELDKSYGPGNALILELESEHVTEIFTGFGERGVRAETVAERTIREAQAYLAAGVPVGEHLADQLLLPIALAGGGIFRSVEPSGHARTQAEVIRMFMDIETRMTPTSANAWTFEV
jgi:RNA 3'-terminal phosphate cyclase (ATP)